MEADELGKELDDLMLPSGPVADPIGPVRNDPLPQQASEQAQSEQLMDMMGM